MLIKDRTANKSRNEVSANTKSQLSSVKFVLRPTKIYTISVKTNTQMVFALIATII